MKLFTELDKKYGIGTVLGAATLDGYRRNIINDRNNNVLNTIRKQQEALDETQRKAYEAKIEEQTNEAKNKAILDRYKNSADEYQKASDDLKNNNNSINQTRLEEAKRS